MTDLPAGAGVLGRYPEALDALHACVAEGRLVPAPSGRIAASAYALTSARPSVGTWWGLAITDATTVSGAPTAETHAAEPFAQGLLDLHHALLREALGHAMAHLRQRSSGRASLLSQQLLQAQCARVAMELSEDDGLPAAVRHADRDARWRAHRRLVTTGRAVLRLLGAAGFLSDGPARDLHLAELTGHLYLSPEDDNGRH